MIKLKNEVLTDLANETARRYYELNYQEKKIEEKLYKRLKRKFKIKADIGQVKKYIRDYLSIYNYTKVNLHKFISASATGIAHPRFVDYSSLNKFIAKKFKNAPSILKKISDWVVYLEYLK
jgi:hypothetical protein